MIAGFIALQQMKAHPGTQSFGLTVYPFALTYGALGALLLLLRISYSRYELFSSFALAVLWFLWVQRVTSRSTEWRLGLVPGVAATAVPQAQRVTWRQLNEPDRPATDVTAVVADFSVDPGPEWGRFLARTALEGVPVYDLRQVTEWLTGQVKFDHLSDNTLSATLSRMVYVRAKWLIDVALVVALAPLLLVIVGVAALAIRLESPGPAFFRQVRMGHRGRSFTILKLRSMRVGAARGEQFTSAGDPRITRVGVLIRKYRIDELPQVWNIILGQMSWIGPRPEAVMLANWYEEEVPFYCYRHMVRPGISGWAQVHQGNVAKPDAAAEKLRYDFYYIKNLSPWLDLLIVAKTIRTILTGFGAR
jgi:lipopolysaccharide/colanic/teichoic acid biosynthesis glycosyltransferase